MQELRQSTAGQIISLGVYLDTTDGDTEEAGLTIANTDIKLHKHNSTSIVNKNSGGATHMSGAVYQSTLDATDTATAGRLEIYTHLSGALVTKNVFMILTQSAFDAKYTGTFNNLGGVAQTADNDTKLTTIADDVANIDGAAMRGTDNAATSAKQDTMETTLNAIPTTAMRGTDGANTVVPPSVSQFNARTLVAANYFDFTTDQVIVTINNDKTGYSISGTITTLDGLNNFDPTSDVVATVTNVTNELSVDVVKINGTTVIGAGVGGNLWRA